MPEDERPWPRHTGADRRPDRDLAGPPRWGRIARRGAGNMNYDRSVEIEREEAEPGGLEDLEHGGSRSPKAAPGHGGSRSPKAAPGDPAPNGRRPHGPGRDRYQRAEPASTSAPTDQKARSRVRKPLPVRAAPVVDPAVSLRRIAGERRAGQLNRGLQEATKAFSAERFRAARSALVPLVTEAPTLPEARELMGLTMYRLGRWSDAVDHLEAFRDLAGTVEQNPVLADCHRALRHWDDVEQLWRELGEASPRAELVVEGRIVAAGAKADRGDLNGAIAMLGKGWSAPKRPGPHHLRRGYALADLYDRAGMAPRARALFAWVADHDPGLADVQQRRRALN